MPMRAEVTVMARPSSKTTMNQVCLALDVTETHDELKTRNINSGQDEKLAKTTAIHRLRAPLAPSSRSEWWCRDREQRHRIACLQHGRLLFQFARAWAERHRQRGRTRPISGPVEPDRIKGGVALVGPHVKHSPIGSPQPTAAG